MERTSKKIHGRGKRAVGKATKALYMAREGREDVHRDYWRGQVYAGNEMVAKWDAESKVMKFEETFRRLMAEGRRDEADFSE